MRLDRSSSWPVLIAITVAGACASDPPRSAPAPASEAAAPRLSPDQPQVFAEWWTNGSVLLHLRPDGAYEVYPALNRYHQPLERGVWSRRNYAALEFDSYSRLTRETERVGIDRDSAGELVLLLGGDLPFVPLDSPPEVLEDSLFGDWEGADYSLSLDRGMRYRWRSPARASSAAVTAHEGWWELSDDRTLVLHPDAAGLAAIAFDLRVEDDEVAIDGAERVQRSH